MDVMLEVKDLTKKFGEFRAVDNVSMSIERGKITLLVGPNGSGKTTLLNCIIGVYRPEYGRVIYDNIDITGRKPHEIVKMGLIPTFQIPSPFYKLTVLENLLLAYQGNPGESIIKCILKNSWIKSESEALDKAFRILDLLELADSYDKLAFTLSGGQLKLLEIGRALMANPKMIVMDEPAGSVNPVLAHRIFQDLRKIKDELGVTLLVVEHRLDIALDYVDYVYAMHMGKIISQGSPERVFNDEKVIEAYLGGVT
ncbi:MAG: ABC transporter ATP-binding protein [archaeon GBS-70-058]|nr:ABC transporter ATP-binding protein [Candidatus Culexarchaeum nevadense]